MAAERAISVRSNAAASAELRAREHFGEDLPSAPSLHS
jgi:hypothetical protein